MDYQNFTKDRSLGIVELKVGELARKAQDAGDPLFSYESTGKVERAGPIRLDGNQYKGQLHYVAEFLPAFALQGLKFDAGPGEPHSVVTVVDIGRGTPSSSASSRPR